jgi:HTH-type transcriptional regulator/antitoxin HigA
MTDLSRIMNTKFSPDWVSPPGDTVQDLLEERNWTQAQLAQQLGFSQEFLARLIAGEVVLTEAVAGCLQQVLGGSVAFWLAREAQYRAGGAVQAVAA